MNEIFTIVLLLRAMNYQIYFNKIGIFFLKMYLLKKAKLKSFGGATSEMKFFIAVLLGDVL